MSSGGAETKRVHAVVRGRVTGVYYRMFCHTRAEQLGLSGWARNLPDQSVELVAQGPAEAIEALLEACRQGPELARVRELQWAPEELAEDSQSFAIRPDGSEAEAREIQRRFPPHRLRPH